MMLIRSHPSRNPDQKGNPSKRCAQHVCAYRFGKRYLVWYGRMASTISVLIDGFLAELIVLPYNNEHCDLRVNIILLTMFRKRERKLL